MANETGRYAARGVSASKQEVHQAIKKIDKGLYPQAFCKIVPDIFDNHDEHAWVMHADGAGTKSSLAYLYWKETGDLSVWKGIAQDAVVMNTDDLLCVGATESMYLSSTIGRNKKRIPGDVIQTIIEGTEEVLAMLRAHGLQIYSTGGETADVGDLVKTIVVDSTVMSRVKKSNVIDAANIQVGDVIVGLASYGHATYENEYNSGMGSNGLTAARHEILSSVYKQKYPETFDEGIDDALVYTGKSLVTDALPNAPLNMGKLILSPTRTYFPILKKVIENYRNDIHGIIHCTGGGQTKILHFIENLHIVKNNLLPIPPLFQWIHQLNAMKAQEMYQVFNMGHRMEIYLPEKIASDVISIARSFNVEAQIIGYVEKSKEKKVTLRSPLGEWVYA